MIGYIFGFRFENGFINACWMIVLVMAVGFTFSWISACIGLSLKQVEAVQAASFTWIFPVVFVSSAFVPVVGMAPFFQVIARHNPVTHFCNLARYLALGPQGIIDPSTGIPVATFHYLIAISVVWIVGTVADLRAAGDPALPSPHLTRCRGFPPQLVSCLTTFRCQTAGNLWRERLDPSPTRPPKCARPCAERP